MAFVDLNAGVVSAAAAEPPEGSALRQAPVQGKENLTVSISGDVLQQARRLKGQIQMSQVVEQALAEKIKEINGPEKATLLKRLRYEREERKGPVFAVGFEEGRRWAERVASWTEIKEHSRLNSTDVQMADPDDDGWFAGAFNLPWTDYNTTQWPTDDNGERITKVPVMCEFGRGFLSGVRSIYELVREEMAADEPVDPDDIPF